MVVPIHRIGDSNDGGGVVVGTPNTTVYANGVLVAVDGSVGTTHTDFLPPHVFGAWRTASGGPTVLVGGIPANGAGDTDSCGHVRVGGSPDVLIAE